MENEIYPSPLIRKYYNQLENVLNQREEINNAWESNQSKRLKLT